MGKTVRLLGNVAMCSLTFKDIKPLLLWQTFKSGFYDIPKFVNQYIKIFIANC